MRSGLAYLSLLAGGLYLATAKAELPGSLDTHYFPVLDGEVRAIAALSNSQAVIGGTFKLVNGFSRPGIARLNADGSLDPSFLPGAGAGTGVVNVVLVQPDGKLLVGGAFTQFNGVNHFNLVRLSAEGSVDASFVPPSQMGTVQALALQADGKIIEGGIADTGAALQRLNANGERDASFNVGLERYDIPTLPAGSVSPDQSALWVAIKSVAVLDNQQIFIQGNFCNVNQQMTGGMPGRVYGVARLNNDGTLDKTFPGGPEAVSLELHDPGAGATAMAAMNEGSVYVGGAFLGRLERLTATGGVDTAFSPRVPFNKLYTDNSISMLRPQSASKLLVSGAFASVNNEPRHHFARIDAATGALDPQFDIEAGTDQAIQAIAVQPDGKLLVGGAFSTVNGVSRAFLARWHGDQDLGSEPQIARQPQAIAISEGETARFWVQAEGVNPQYQWLFNGTPITGATNYSLIITNAKAAAIGDYAAQVTAGQQALTSAPAHLTVHTVANASELSGIKWSTWWAPPFEADRRDIPGWIYETNVTYQGQAAIRTADFPPLSLDLSYEGTPYVRAEIDGPGTLTFAWKHDPAFGVGLDLETANFTRYLSSTNLDWQIVTVPIGEGVQTLTWSLYLYEDTMVYLDMISFTTDSINPACKLLPGAFAPDSGFHFQVQAEAGTQYQLQVSDNLKDWQPLDSTPQATGSTAQADASATNHSQRFYRAVVK